MSLSIRIATSDDAVTIADFNARMAMETESKHLDAAIVLKGVTEAIEHPVHGIYFVAEIDGAIVGQAMITYEWSDWRNGQFWWIQSVYVLEEWRGKKVFTALYQRIMDLAKTTPGVCGVRLYVEASNERAQKTYSNLGMNKTGYEMFEIEINEGTEG